MLSYRHAYHAGNFADVLKHCVFIHTLAYMTQKDKPLRIIDTHAGAGLYKLSASQSLKNREFDNGIGKLWNDSPKPQLINDYLQQVRRFNHGQHLSHYPGSPLLAQAIMRGSDRLFLHELHSSDWRLLSEAIGDDKNVKVIESDGFAGMQALLPPPDRRALILIDPSYEIKSDYQHLVKQVIQAHKRFATGTFAIWYPVVTRARISEMEMAFKKSGITNIQLFELGLSADNPDYGMTSSGMIVINPPWTLWSAMEECLPFLVDTLGATGGNEENEYEEHGDAKNEAFYRMEQLVAEKV